MDRELQGGLIVLTAIWVTYHLCETIKPLVRAAWADWMSNWTDAEY